jgi:hypothetical protein
MCRGSSAGDRPNKQSTGAGPGGGRGKGKARVVRCFCGSGWTARACMLDYSARPRAHVLLGLRRNWQVGATRKARGIDDGVASGEALKHHRAARQEQRQRQQEKHQRQRRGHDDL